MLAFVFIEVTLHRTSICNFYEIAINKKIDANCHNLVW